MCILYSLDIPRFPQGTGCSTGPCVRQTSTWFRAAASLGNKAFKNMGGWGGGAGAEVARSHRCQAAQVRQVAFHRPRPPEPEPLPGETQDEGAVQAPKRQRAAP